VPEWRIYYADGSVVSGTTRAEWDAAPSGGVQVLVLMVEPLPAERRWTGVDDRVLWTGDDVYQLEDWSPKFGAWMDRNDYDVIWERACGDD
jgi:hypothetical protein